MHTPPEVNTRARRKHCFSVFFFSFGGKPTSCRNTTRLFLMLKIVMYPQRYHIRVSVILILVTMEELAVKQLQASLAHVRQITRDLSVKVRKIMLFVNHSLKNDKLCLSVSLRASLGEPFWKVARERHARRDAKDDVLCRLASLAKSKFSLKLCFNFRLRRHEFWAQYFGPFNPLVWLYLVELGWSLKYAVRLISLFMTIINQNHPDQVNELNTLNHKVQSS